MAKSKVTSKDTNWQASYDWSGEDWKPYKLRAIKLFKGLDELAQLFGTRKRLWSKTIIKKGKFRGLAKAIHMDYGELKAELERMERGRLARECAKLDPVFEKAMAEEGLSEDTREWPEY